MPFSFKQIWFDLRYFLLVDHKSKSYCCHEENKKLILKRGRFKIKWRKKHYSMFLQEDSSYAKPSTQKMKVRQSDDGCRHGASSDFWGQTQISLFPLNEVGWVINLFGHHIVFNLLISVVFRSASTLEPDSLWTRSPKSQMLCECSFPIEQMLFKQNLTFTN